MCARYAVADEVRVLTGGVDLFGALYELAKISPSGGIWVEAFGAVRGASIIELTGDRHRESVREATLSAFTATVFIKDDVPDIRSVGTLTWREKRTPLSLTGFLASARATHLTIRYRPIEIVESAAESKMGSDSFVISSMGSTGTREKEPVSSEVAAEAVSRAVQKITQNVPNRRKQAEAAVVSWADMPDTDESEPATFGWGDLASAIEDAEEDAPAPAVTESKPSAKSKATKPAETQASLSWGEVAEASTVSLKSDVGASTAGAVSWDAVAEESQKVSSRKAMLATDLERGDVLIHPTLGNCTILQVVSDSVVMIKPKHDTSRKITIKLFDIVPSDKKGVYTLIKR